MGKKRYGKSYSRNKYEGHKGAVLRMLPAVIMLAVVPLIVRQYKHENNLAEYAWYGGSEVSYEFFLASKSVALMLLAICMIGCISVRLWKEKKKLPFKKLFIPLFAYGVLSFLSACVSVNKEYSFSGGYEQFESVWALLSYVLIVYYIYLYAQSELELQVVTDAICFSATAIGLIGTFQGLGFDIIATKFYQKLMTTESFLNMVGGELILNFTDGQAVATLYNPNYLGVYGSFIVPFLAMMILYEKNKWRRLWHIGNFVVVMMALLSSRSRAGLIAAVIAIGVALLFAVKKVLKWWYLVIPGINFAVAFLLLVNAYNDNLIFERLQNIFEGDKVEVVEEIAEDGSVIRKTGLTDMYTTPQGVVFCYNEVAMLVGIEVDGDTYGFYAIDDKGEQVQLLYNENGTEFWFSEPALAGVMLTPVYYQERLGFSINASGEWNFVYNDEKESFQYITVFGKESDMIMAEAIGFKNHQSSFSGRGYIWSRTIPLLKEHIFLGSGPDTFMFEYPQEDYLRMKQHGFEEQIMTKPHSWYLQVGVQTGVLSLICLLVFYGWYAVWSIRLYAFRKLGTQAEAFGMASFIASIGYMISGISNDSMVVTAPVFWGMIGLGIGANVLVSRERKKEKVNQ